jgi:electron transfer flavoprotein beta subunit
MHILIPMKRVPDTETKIALADGKIDPNSLKSWIINPYDEYAIEESLRLVEAQGGGKVTMIAIGSEAVQETIRKALAMGADEAYHLQDAAFEGLDPLGQATVLAAAVEKIGEYDLIWTGWKEVDDDLGQTGILLADMLDLPHVANIITVEKVEGDSVVVRAEAEGGYQTVKVSTPAVLTESQGPHEPRYPSLKGIMGAKKKPLMVWSASDLGVDTDSLAPKLEVMSMSKPATRAGGRIIEGEPADAARELVRLLHEEAKAL